MEERFKVCGNCGHCTMRGGEFICIDPQNRQQEVEPMGARRPCFVVTTQMTSEEWIAEALRLADEYAMYYDNLLSVEEGAEQARTARAALAAHLAIQITA